ncbi:hypothetical protein AMECASPLE_031406 [Ameca splendens]|uniref:Uncharacterized protein n=1 Tax=Ameca splendens TaxID=208324 RepID=A0ABV0Z468_9TELE
MNNCSLINTMNNSPESASSFMTWSLLRILSPESVFPALTQFLSSDHRTLPIHCVCKPATTFLCNVNLLSPDNHAEEPKINFLFPQRILRSLVALFLSLSLFSVLCSARKDRRNMDWLKKNKGE